MSKIRTILADDEGPARKYLSGLLSGFEDVELIATARNGREAIELIKKEKPDLAILDLQMPETTGIEVVKRLRKNELPSVIFVTAFDDFAVEAFEVNAVDYLLKPVEKARLRGALNRVVERLESEGAVETERAKLSALADTSQPDFLERIPLKRAEAIHLVKVSSVSSIVANGELLEILSSQDGKFLINYRLKDLEQRLSPDQFVRLSRGTIINIDFVKKLSPLPGGTYSVELTNGEEHTSSRIQSRALRRALLKI